MKKIIHAGLMLVILAAACAPAKGGGPAVLVYSAPT
jgi:hypothetical protein